MAIAAPQPWLHRPADRGASRSYGHVARDVAKRTLDITVALVALVLLLPVLVVTVIAIRIDTPGPALFVQPRMGSRRSRIAASGWEPHVFRLYKFRSMRVGNDTTRHQDAIRRFVAGDGADGDVTTYKPRDPDVTRVGSVLRRLSIDELPQLLNVLKGDMSLVGPRPVPVYEAAHHAGSHLRRYATRPGMTGLWQVSGRCDTGFADMMRLDLEYVENRSLAGDVKILLRTVPAVISRRGAA